ncbi:hypothetical protein A2U01_0061766 [Trifolium medium]|uniref:Uncharacterized protein n=1 Tax=Trifolium medium TaxID=97028 RepID=A0A392RV87_9FABA|nr:hypothetical protein [Trifolium medium]
MVQESRLEVESFSSGTRSRESTSTSSYPVKDREWRDILAPKWYVYEDFVCYALAESKDNQTW